MFDRLGMVIRLRDPWEAVDLGFILTRRHWTRVMALWLAVLAPLCTALYALFQDHLWVPPLVVWWLAPFLDRLVLHVLAKAIFGEPPSLGEGLRHLPGLLRHGLVATLSWRRLSPQRSFVLPVWQLEEQSGAGFRPRCAILLRRGRSQAILLTFVCFALHAVVFFGVLAGVSIFVPAGSDFQVMDAVFGSGSDRVRWVDLMLSLLPILSLTLIEPFYVGGGFALYLNRRVELEGWDLEVAFRKAASRIARALGQALVVLLLLGCPPALHAQGERPTAREALAEVLKQPEFQVKQRKKGLHWKDDGTKKEPEQRSVSPAMLELFKLLGVAAKWLVIALAAAAIAYVLWRNRRVLLRTLKVTSKEELPEILMGMDIRPETLPAGLDRVASRLWAEGNIRAALALLYRGALAHLVHTHRAPISRGATEGDCLRKAEETLTAPASDYFGRLTRTWLRVAYADLGPEPGSERLCTEWPSHFQQEARR